MTSQKLRKLATIFFLLTTMQFSVLFGDVYGSSKSMQKAYFAGGCFWGVEHYFEKESGVLSVLSGYMGGIVKNPTYMDVVRGKSGHLELVEVKYDETKVSYEKLVKLFLKFMIQLKKMDRDQILALSIFLLSLHQQKKRNKQFMLLR